MERKMRDLPRRLLLAGALCGLLGLSTGTRAPGREITKASILASPVVIATADPRDNDTPEPVALALFGAGLVLAGGIIRRLRIH